ncbi:alginate export family protein [Thalassotalea sp. G2M2-11]|uniref:alginate export family protein n=1 Tax=Thalassotalea sp. G2M2-11 TaxID=2787627 RepID=UPI0019D2F31F|nr:alginate export family protein [Thalassotalea sp. G2M2-11]
MKTNTKTLSLSLISSAILASVAFNSAAAGNNNASFSEALADSKVNVSFRARYEGVDQDGANGASDKDATALTLKSRLTVKTGAYNGLSLGVEVDNVTALVDDYNDLTLDYSGSDAVVADPEITDVNQAFLQYKTGKFTATAGRQRVLHNNQRFVGGVGWRQNEQTYDGYRFQYKASDSLTLDYSYIYNANRIFAADSKKADNLSGDFHLATANYKVNKSHKVGAFAYLLDFDKAHAMSSSTYGALYNGKFDAIFVNASVATQSDNGDNPVSYDASYLNAEIGAKLENFTVLGGYEVLGSDDGKAAFSTPFATLHKFQGFADSFLGTGSSAGLKNGVEDTYVTVKTKLSGIGLSATFHDLTSDEGSIDYGTELDIAASYTIANKYKLLVKYADYSADDLGTDTSKLWIQLAAKF